MGLSSELISLFAKTTNDKPVEQKETTVYATIVKDNGKTYAKIDGSNLLTPVSTTADSVDGERVTVMIKNHTAIVTGNITSPAARTGDVQEAVNASRENASKISEFEILVAYHVKTEDLEASTAIINRLRAELAEIGRLDAAEAELDELQAQYASLDYVLAKDVEALEASIENLEVIFGTFADISADNMAVLDAEITNLRSHNASFTYVSADILQAVKADITELDVDKLDAETAKITYANIDFSNIGQAAMEYFYAQSGLIDNVTISDGTITGMLVGVTIKGDLIEANTLAADKLVILGEDGVYYKLNTNGETVSSEQTDYNSLNGQIITAKSVTAEKISVDDLVAFDATIGGFNITEDSIFSEVKDSEGNTTRGIYMDTDGRFNFGDGSNYVKYYRDDEGNYHLAISADTIMYDINGSQHSIADLGVIGEYVKIGTYEGEPCIELGETDSEFKVYITNTKILFTDSSDALAYFSNQSLYIKKAVIEDELQQGDFVWKVRANGNLGIVWKGADT